MRCVSDRRIVLSLFPTFFSHSLTLSLSIYIYLFLYLPLTYRTGIHR